MKLLVLIVAVLTVLKVSANEKISTGKIPVPPPTDVSNDTMFFDLTNAVVTTSQTVSYYDIPMSIKTTGAVSSFDFWFKFDQTKLTYYSTITVQSQLDAYSYFNTNNQFISNTTSGPSLSYQTPSNTTLLIVRFQLTNACDIIDTNDFNTVTTLFNGNACKHKFLYQSGNAAIDITNNGILCSGSTVQLTTPATIYGKTISTWSWDLGNGFNATTQNVSTVYPTGDLYAVALDVQTVEGCFFSLSSIFTVNQTPYTDFTYTIDVVNDSVDFLNNSAIANYLWNFGDNMTSVLQNPVHHYDSGGAFPVSLIATSIEGCSDTAIVQITLNKPTSNFTHVGGCVGSDVQFNDFSTSTNGTIVGWAWDFGDGATSISQSPSHIYTAPGTYQVTLTAEDNFFVFGSITHSITITSKPIVQFTAATLSGCSPLQTTFNNATTTQSGSSYHWNLGDNVFSSVTNPLHTYTGSNTTFSVKLVVITPSGCSDSLTKPAYINVLTTPAADFSNNSGCVNAGIDFTELFIPGEPNSSWSWNFGDGSTSTIQNPIHVFANPGNYPVSLVVSNSLGCSSQITKTTPINTKPNVVFNTPNLSGCAPFDVSFSNQSSAVSGSTYSWSFGDNTVSSSLNPTHNYPIDGDYSVKLVVTSPGGCSDSLVNSSYIHVFNGITADFSESNRCANTPTNFFDNSILNSGSVASWNWNFGNGSSSTVANPSFVYIQSGTYQVTLTVISDAGCSNVLTKTVTVDSKPSVDFQADVIHGCSPLNVNFDDLTTAMNGSTYSWTLGDGTTASSQTATAIYTAINSYSVKLVVTSPEGCTDSITKNNYISLQSSPQAFFSSSSISATLPSASITFTNSSIDYANLTWSFGDNTFSTTENPEHLYADSGQYQVCLIANSSYGCSDTLCKNVSVTESNKIAVPAAFTPNGDNNNDVFLIRGGPFKSIEMKILNEWGNQLFVSTNQSNGWDGTFNGTPQSSGTYEYIVTGKTTDNQDINLYGVVNLTR